MKIISKIKEIASMFIKQDLSYSGFTWASMAVNILGIIVTYYIWMAVYGSKTEMHGMSKNQMITYIILSGVLLSGVQWMLNLYISQLIQSGGIAMELLRPIDFQLSLFSARLGGFVSYTVIQCIPVLIVSSLIFGISPPKSVICALLFVISLLMAIGITFFIEFCVGLIAFYTNSTWGLQHMKDAILFFSTGAVIPLAFFPGWLKSIIVILPFKDIVYTPVSIYMGIVTGEQAIKAMFFQLIWLILFFFISRVFFKFAIKKITVQGG